MVVEDLYGSLLVNTEFSFAIDFMCVFRDDFSESLPPEDFPVNLPNSRWKSSHTENRLELFLQLKNKN